MIANYKREDFMSDYLQELIDELEPPDEIKDRVILFHYLKGLNDNPYQLRRTKVHLPESSALSILAQEKINNQNIVGDKSQQKILEMHRVVMQEYIRYLDRDNTFLSLIIKNFTSITKENDSIENYSGNLSTNSNAKNKSKCILREVSHNDNYQVQWEISQLAVKILIQNTKNDKNEAVFLHEIYNKVNGGKVDEEWKYAFQYARSELFGNLCERDMSIESRKKIWDLISSIQGILVFLSSAINSQTNLSCSFIIIKNSDFCEPNETELAVMIVSPSIAENRISDLKVYFARSAKTMFGRIKSEGNQKSDFLANGFMAKYFPLVNDDINEKCFKLIGKSIYHSSEANIDEAMWAMLLMHNLMNRKHEGQLLDFFIVCGELSQFKDLPQIKFRDLNMKSRDDLKWDRNTNTLNTQKTLDRVANQIANEHYPWFESGRYALFWNTVSKHGDNSPIGLVSIEHFNWINIIQSRLQAILPLEMPNCLICYIYGNPQKIGVKIIEKSHDTSTEGLNSQLLELGSKTSSQAKELLRWQDNKWKLIANESRKNNLKNTLDELLNNPPNLDKILEIIIEVSEDPEKGATIVFVQDDETIKQFGSRKKNMGEPWDLGDINSEDIIALVAQDGATLCPIDSRDLQSLQYRKLLLSSDSSLSLLDQIEEKWPTIKSQDAEWPLLAKGSRRWNAAIASCNYLVDTVLVISQDGNIQIWHVDNKPTGELKEDDMYTFDNINRLEIHEFLLRGENKLIAQKQLIKQIS